MPTTANALADFLAAESGVPVVTPMPTVEIVPTETEVDIVAPVPPKAPDPYLSFETLAADLKRIGMSSKNLHYRYKGKEFYGMHLLADLVYDVEKFVDDLIEVYFMGECGCDAPRMEDICRKATEIEVIGPSDELYFVGCLHNIVFKALRDVEQIKKDFPTIKAGTHAILDNISQKCLVAIGLLDRTLRK